METHKLKIAIKTQEELALIIEKLAAMRTMPQLAVEVEIYVGNMGRHQHQTGELPAEIAGTIFAILFARYQYLYVRAEQELRDVMRDLLTDVPTPPVVPGPNGTKN